MSDRLLCALTLCFVLGGWSFAALADQCTPAELNAYAAASADGDAEIAEIAETNDADTEQDGEWYTTTTCDTQGGCSQNGGPSSLGIAVALALGIRALRRRARA